MEFNYLALLAAAVSTLAVGFIWYHPKVFGNAWMKASGVTDEQAKSGNMALIFGLSVVLAFLLSFQIQMLAVHQWGAFSLVGGDLDTALPSYTAFMADYNDAFRTFKHGALHGFLAGFFIALPIIGTNALFERKNAKYIFINSGFWTVCMTIMGGIICAWV